MERTSSLVTGCAGFVGSHLTEALLKLGHTVVGVDIVPRSKAVNLSAVMEHPRFVYFERNIDQAGVLEDCYTYVPHIANVFHLAAVVSVEYSMSHAQETMHTNYTATMQLHEDAREADCRTFVFAGSAAEYGADERTPLKEAYIDDATEQLSPYGRAKYLSSRAIEASGFGCSLRFFNIFGPRQDPTNPYSGVISIFINKGVCGEPLTIFGDGGQTRDFIYVGDVVRTYLLAAGLTTRESIPLTGAYNIGTGGSISIGELARMIAEATGGKSDIRLADARGGDIYHSCASIERFAAATGFVPEIGMREGLMRTIDWMRKTQEM